MPVDYLEIRSQLEAFCDRAKLRQHSLESIQSRLQKIFRDGSLDLESIRGKILAEGQKNAMLRCALPVTEAISQAYPPPQVQFQGTLLAVDGSQVFPSRHRRVEFGALNTAAVVLQPGSGQAPRIVRHSRLLDEVDLRDEGAPASESYISLLRDLEERRLSAQLAAEYPGMAITLTDGGLELFREPRASHAYEKALEEYLLMLSRLSDQQVIYAGYVDKPNSNLVVNMLGVFLGTAQEDDFADGLVDRALFGGMLPEPGSRSAVFEILSPQSEHFQEELAIHFFYLNVSQNATPSIARVEIPGWVAEKPDLVNFLHQVLLDQCSASGGKPFPYLIHRAHEEAVIHYEDTQQLEEMIVSALVAKGIGVGVSSGKQDMKELEGRTWTQR